MQIQALIQINICSALETVYGLKSIPSEILINHTKKEFEGEYTVVIFPFVKLIRKNPVEIGEKLGSFLKKEMNIISSFNVVKGFLNLSFNSGFWRDTLHNIQKDDAYGFQEKNGQKILVEFSSPNTNKPLHLGHVRNILLGWSCSNILEAAGYDAIRVQIINDRGIAICKSMLAWKKFGNGETPELSKEKPDHFVGRFYVEFEKRFQEEYRNWQTGAEANQLLNENEITLNQRHAFFKKFKNTYFNEYSELGIEARNLLLLWEKEDGPTLELWQKLNNWVYKGFQDTYDQLGVQFDQIYYESETYLLGKDFVMQGLQDGTFYKKEDQSIWVDLTKEGLDEKILLRKDGTSVYLTQDLGTAELRYQDYKPKKMVYVVADEQDYHFQVLFEVLKKLDKEYATGLFHLSYGMVDLPDGKMKSREGTVVDADDLIAEVIKEAKVSASERGEVIDLSEFEQEETLRKIGIAALKFFIIKVHPKKRMVFNPKESVDMQGQTGPYIQNAFVRIQSIMRKQTEASVPDYSEYNPKGAEIQIIRELVNYPTSILQAARDLDPSIIANYSYQLAKLYHKFYHDFRILNAETPEAKSFRIKLSIITAEVLQSSSKLLGIEMPNRM